MNRLSIPGAVAVALWGSAAGAQSMNLKQPDAAQLLREVERLAAVGRVLYVAAHPDDENSRLLAFLVEHEKLSAAYLSLTRGEGGQNLIGPEQAPLLGLIRTQELLAARDIDGAQQLFGSERDFGYSKSPEETLAIWGQHDALGDVVWAIRRFQPDVIVTRFSPDDRETHGHHTASAILAVQAFRAAADARSYPEQLAFVQPWQARRIVWNKGVFNAKPGAEAPAGFIALDIGGYDPLLGDSAPEIAARSRSMHKSQGFGATAQRGHAVEYFRVLDGEPIKTSFLDGIDFTWTRVPGAEKLAQLLARARAQFDLTRPAASIPALLEAAAALEALPDNPWKAEKQTALRELIAACAGLHLDALASEATVNPGGELKVALSAINRSDSRWVLRSAQVVGGESVDKIPSDKALELELHNNEFVSLDRVVTLPKNTALSNPHWLDEAPSAGRWLERDPRLAGMPEQPAPLHARFLFEVEGHALALERPVVYSWNDPVMGERRRPLEVLPAATFNPASTLLVFPDGAERELRVTVRASRGPVSGTLRPRAPAGFSLQPASLPFHIEEPQGEQLLSFRITPSQTNKEAANSEGTLALLGEDQAGEPLDRSVVHIDHSHIPIQTLTPPAQVKLVRVELKRASTRIGYIPGAGDEVPEALRQVGYQVTLLSDEALAGEPLDSYEAIVAGVRAYNVNPRMPRYYKKLMDYVSAGGTLLVQYNTQNRISKIAGQLGPWPFNISQDRVTDETAAVTVLEPEHALLRFPNKIGDSDFSNWVQERGIYFADSWDPHYTPLFAMSDPRESPKKGSLLYTRFGKGVFIYTGLDFFRQLPAGVPGAYRLFANLLAHGQ